MTLSTSLRRNDYTGNGAVDTYAYSFKVSDDDDLTVMVRNPSTDVVTTLTKTTDYTVSGVGLAAGGNIALVNSAQAWLDGDGDLLTGWKLTILGSAPNLQSTSIRNQSTFYPSTHEEAFDYFVMLIQQLQEQINRCVKVSEDQAASGLDLKLNYPLTASGLVAVKSSGDGLEIIPSATVAVTTTQIRNGTTAVADTSTSQAITFGAVMPSTDYSINAVFLNTADTLPLIQPITITAKSTSGFTASWSQALDSANYSLVWEVMEY